MQKEGKKVLHKKYEAMVANIEGVQGYAAALKHDFNKEKAMYQPEGRAMKEHVAKVERALIGQIGSRWNIGGEVRDALSKHAGELVACQGPMQDSGHSIITLNNFIDDTRGRFLKADPVVLMECIEEVQKYLLKVHDIPQRVVNTQEAVTNISASAKDSPNQAHVALASAQSVQEQVRHMQGNLTAIKAALTEASQGYQTMCKELIQVEEREHEDMMTCVGGIQEAKDIGLSVTIETEGLQEFHKTMHL